VFRFCRQIETKRTLPAMIDEDGNKCFIHEGIFDLIAVQLELGKTPLPVGDREATYLDCNAKLAETIKPCTGNTRPGLDTIRSSRI